MNSMKKIALALFSATAVGLATLPSQAVEARVEVGILTCDVEGGAGLILGSNKDMTCTFKAIDDFVETYIGSVTKLGIDIGTTEATTISWAVFAPTVEMEAGALEGNYAGLSAEATLGVGLGANALVGGLDKSIALQPFSGQTQEGLNIAGGIGVMQLRNPR